MEKKKVATERPFPVNGLMLIPVTETRIIQYRTRFGISYIARKTPLAVIVIVRGEKKAYRVTSEETTIDELVKEYPTIKESIDRL